MPWRHIYTPIYVLSSPTDGKCPDQRASFPTEVSGQLRADELAYAAMRRTGATSARDLARKLGLTSYDAPKRVERWLRGENEPRYEQTVELLQLAGLLNEAGLEAARAEAEAAMQTAERLRARRGVRPPGSTGTG